MDGKVLELREGGMSGALSDAIILNHDQYLADCFITMCRVLAN